ncbi:MAG: membrane protein insertase YidC [Pseudomonadota bacterium]
MDRNTLLAIVLSAAVLLVWELVFGAPQRAALEAAREARQAEQAQEDPTSRIAREAASRKLTLGEALAQTPDRVAIETPTLRGSINLIGGRFDDLVLKDYRETLDPDSDNIHLLQPATVEDAQYIQQDWLYGAASDEPRKWTLSTGTTLTPETPIVLTRQEGDIVFEKIISVDEQYMFTVEQTARNTGDNLVSVTPFALVIQKGIPDDLKGGGILHEGAVGIVGGKLYDRKYKKLAKGKTVDATGTGGWIGITNKYWLAAAIPPQDVSFEAKYRNNNETETAATEPEFNTYYTLPAVNLNGGQSHSVKSHVFAGAKDVDILQAYEKPVEKGGLGILDLDKAVDWGSLNFLTRPIFYVLNFFGNLTGNFGIAILILTLITKAILFPLANKGYESMTRMKQLQPKLEKLKERAGEDKAKLQQDMMELYKKENVNPMAGCLPILIQMPIFFALYKTLFVTLELRHEPFVGWIRDLSAPDPTSIFNLFGLIPWEPTALPLIGPFMGLGVLPILMGVAMWFQMSLNPPPSDPTQRQVMAMLPWIFMFLFSSFAAGLVIYWIWNTVLSVAQQVIIMRRNGVELDLKDRFSFLFPGDKTVAAGAAAAGASGGTNPSAKGVVIDAKPAKPVKAKKDKAKSIDSKSAQAEKTDTGSSDD